MDVSKANEIIKRIDNFYTELSKEFNISCDIIKPKNTDLGLVFNTQINDRNTVLDFNYIKYSTNTNIRINAEMHRYNNDIKGDFIGSLWQTNNGICIVHSYSSRSKKYPIIIIREVDGKKVKFKCKKEAFMYYKQINKEAYILHSKISIL